MPKFYVFTYQASDCAFTVTCNGFQVFDCKDGGGGGGPLNPYMLGKGNELRIKFTRKGDNASFSAGIQEGQEGDMMDTSAGGDMTLPEGDEIVHVFDGDADDLKTLLDQASKGDADTMLKFAMDYCQAIREGDMDALKTHNRFRLEQASKDFGVPLEQLAPQMLEMFASFKDAANVGPDDVDVRMITHDKVWEVRRKDGNALLYMEEDGGSMSVDFIVAVLEDGPQVVR
jgi:hypothetical protein